ncbi:MAG TPA: STAS domain-containing protein [Phycisphaerales bacterium]|nr:STAS domain-containing protein [Phycisphaerales bacterium]
MYAATHELGGPDGCVLIVRLPPDLNHETAETVRSLVQSRLPNRDGAGVVLDARDLRFISSIGIAALLEIEEFCRDRGCPMIVGALPASQESFLKMLKLHDRFAREATIDEAIRRAAGA